MRIRIIGVHLSCCGRLIEDRLLWLSGAETNVFLRLISNVTILGNLTNY
jgi:hypothetical protein